MWVDHRLMSRIDLEFIRDWATAKLSRDQELQRTVDQYVKLRETADSILARMDAATWEISSRATPARQARLRLVWSKDHGDAQMRD
jgi:hypothetical protein